MKVVELGDVRVKRGAHTPKSILQNALDNVELIDDIVISIRQKDGSILHALSDMNNVKAIGMYELGKTLVLNDMWEDA